MTLLDALNQRLATERKELDTQEKFIRILDELEDDAERLMSVVTLWTWVQRAIEVAVKEEKEKRNDDDDS